MAVPIYTEQETMQILRDAQNKDGNAFRVKIWHKSAPNFQEHLAANFSGVTLEQVETWDEWVPRLFNGCPGLWSMQVSHGTQPAHQYGGPLKFSVDGPPGKKPVLDFKMLQAEEYSGPRDLKYPFQNEAQKKSETNSETPSLPNNQVGNQAMRESADIAGKTSGADKAEAIRLQQIALELQRQEKYLEEQRQNMKLAEMEARLKAQYAPPAQQTGQPDATVMLLMEMLKQQKEDARAAQAQQAMLLERLFSRPTVDPVVEKLIEKVEKLADKEKDPGQKHVIELIGTVAQMSSQMIASQAELMSSMNGAPESPGFKLAQQGLMVLQGILSSQAGQPQLALNPGEAQGAPQQFAGLPPEATPAPVEKPKLTRVEALVRCLYRKDSPEEVYKRFKKCTKDEEFLHILGKHQGNWNAVAQELLGPWLFQNIAYVQPTLLRVMELAQADGIMKRAEPSPAAATVEATPVATEEAPKRRKNGAKAHATQTPAPEVVEAPMATVESAPAAPEA